MTDQHATLSLSDEERGTSLQDLDRQHWGYGMFFPPPVVVTCHALQCKPLRDFTIEGLRIIIGQRISLGYLVSLAIERLEQNPLAAGNFYDGDLLASVLRVPARFWLAHPDMRQAVKVIIARLDPLLAEWDKTAQ
ncbi:MAG: contact-dependent growth inhibition system immunity protein [Ktedonobacteraceae bacterium]